MPHSASRNTHRSQAPADDSEDLRLYRSRFGDLSRGQLEVRNRALYHRLRRAGLLRHVPLKQRPRRTIPDLLAYYRKHYPGVTRGQLAKRDSSLYSRLRDAGLITHVPSTVRFIPDPLAYYHVHYKGLSRGELHRRDCGLYLRLYRAGLLGEIPRKTRKQGPVQEPPDTARSDGAARCLEEPRRPDEGRDGKVTGAADPTPA